MMCVFAVFRCSKSARASQISLFLEEPTTCNYILTVEASFLCPLLHSTDDMGLFSAKEPTEKKGVGQGVGPVGQSAEDRELGDDGGVKSSVGGDGLEEELELDDHGNVKPSSSGVTGGGGLVEQSDKGQEDWELNDEDDETPSSRNRHLR